jgi:hypothetical protein
MHCLAAHTGGSFFRWTVATGRSVIGVTCRNAFACGPSFIALCTAAYQLLTQGLSAWRCSFHLMQSHRDTCIDYSADALSRACALSLSAHVAWSICDNGVVRMVLSQRRRDRGSAGMTRLGGFQTILARRRPQAGVACFDDKFAVAARSTATLYASMAGFTGESSNTGEFSSSLRHRCA